MKFEHIGIAVRSIEDSTKIWEGLFGLKPKVIAQVEPQKVRVAVFDAGPTKIELLEPMGEDSPIAKFLEKRGEGIHHICFEVKNIEATVRALREKGIFSIDKSPRPGAFAKKVMFLRPSSTGGVLIELCEKQTT